MKFVIITPVKNEEKYIKFALESVVNQTILPERWIIVDDGSTDNTSGVVEKWTKTYDWIILHKLETQAEQRRGGSKVVNAFNTGFQLVKDEQWDFIVKLDGDLILPPNYFEEISNIFVKFPKVGLTGGIILNKIGDSFIQEGKMDYHIRGAFKSYRRECFFAIGGFKPIWNWDGIDEMEAMYKGWETRCIDIKVKHLRPTTAAYNKKEHAFKSGYEAYRLRMSLVLLVLRSIYKLKTKPYIIYSYNYLKGYINAFLNKSNFLIDRDLAKFINRFHYKRIVKLTR